jgi:hypothetical protein
MISTLSFYNVLPNPDKYVENIESNGWKVIDAEAGKFRGIQERKEDELSVLVNAFYPDYNIELNFIRKSPLNQEEPHYIHTDEMHGDKTVILYLNKTYPENYGTTLYDDNEVPILVNKAQYNSIFIFDSNIKHSRNIKENFGFKNDARMVQVMFLKKKHE